MQSIIFGPFDGMRAWDQAEAAGFAITSQDEIEREQVVTIPVDLEDPVQEDATAWLTGDQSTGIVLIVSLPSVDERVFPGNLGLDKLREYESRWKWPVWYESIILSIPAPVDISNSVSEAIALVQSKPVGCFEMIWRREALGIGRSGRSLVEVRLPPADESFKIAIETIATGVPLSDFD